jgi:tryptophan halogenase
MIRKIVVLGGGSAGLLAALSLKKRFPDLAIEVVRSTDIGVIGVGEGTTNVFPEFLLRDLGLHPRELYAEAQPTWKLGLRFLWGPRKEFFYTFSTQYNFRWPDLPKNNGFYCNGGDLYDLDLWSGYMHRGKAFPRLPNGGPDFVQHKHVAFHIENVKLVSYLEGRCADAKVEFIDATMKHAEKSEAGISALIMEDGRRVEADLFVDASGFRSELLGRALEVPFNSFDNQLYCDRAVIGGWSRTDEPILPYTTCETMNAGWCWQIEHENWINRGYVYSSRFISDEDALSEFLAKNPKVSNQPRVVRYRTGRYRDMWIGNVVAVGNASGFVEPLEATALSIIITQCRAIGDVLTESNLDPTPGMRTLVNRFLGASWDEVRDFIAMHYRFNTRLETPFWQAARADIPLGTLEPIVDFYQENGPTSIGIPVFVRPSSTFGMEGYLAMLIGMNVPHRKQYQADAAQLRAWEAHRRENGAKAAQGLSVREALNWVHKACSAPVAAKN